MLTENCLKEFHGVITLLLLLAELVLKDARIRANQPDRTSLSSPAKV